MTTNNHTNITYSAELMQNYLLAEVISPQKKFQALQTKDGLALLFSISSDDVFYLIAQQNGAESGWIQLDLSSMLAKNFGAKPIKAKTFGAAQNVKTGKIDLALALTVGDTDYLYLCLDNEPVVNSINPKTIQWRIMNFDDPVHKGIKPDILDIFMSESSAGEYIVVDLSRSTFNPSSPYIERYYIDPVSGSKQRWNPMVLGGDLEPGAYSSLGRKSGDRVDGTYTLGQIGGQYELMYAPLYNVWNKDAPPTITRLVAPAGATALATITRDDQSTDLFVTADRGLFYFPSDKQEDGDSGIQIISNSILDGVSKLYAYASGSQYVVWGQNRANEIFYTACDIADVSNSGAWSLPIPIMTDVEQFSPYLNRSASANEFFSSSGNILTKAIKSPQTSIWNTQSVRLKAPDTRKAVGLSSYTTRIQLSDQDEQPLAGEYVQLKATTRIPVYLNNLYYILDPTPIPVRTDNLGSITIIELVDDLVGTKFTVSHAGGSGVLINPMDNPLNKIASLDNADKVQGAEIKYYNDTTKPLIKPGTSQDDLKSLAQANKNIGKAYQKAGNSTPLSANSPMLTLSAPHLEGFENTIATDVGDLYRWLETGISSVVQLVEDTATGFWHFVVTIGDQIYSGILDCAEKIAGAVKWIYNAIKTAIEDLIKFLEFLFEWQDIIRTKKVIKNLLQVYLDHEVEQIEVVRKEMDDQFAKVIKAINDWADLPDWAGLGDSAKATPASKSNSTHGKSAPSTFLSHHFQNNAGSITQHNPPRPPDPSEGPIQRLFTALKTEGEILDKVIDEFGGLTKDFQSMNLEELIKKLIGIMADGVLASAQNVLDCMLDILYELAKASVEALETPIHIPVISDILNDLDIPDFSILDIVTLVVAVPVTLTYKLMEHKAPFPNNQYTKFLIEVSDYDNLVNAFNGKKLQKNRPDSSYREELTVSMELPEEYGKVIFIIGHLGTGFLLFVSTILSGFEAAEETGENPFSIPSAVVGFSAAVLNGLTNILVPKDPIKNTAFTWVNRVTTGSVILSKIIFSGPAQKKFGASSGTMKILKAADGRALGAVVNTVLIVPALGCTLFHFIEMAIEDKPDKTLVESILEESSNITSYITRASYCYAVNLQDPVDKVASIAIMSVANLISSGLQTAEPLVEAAGS